MSLIRLLLTLLNLLPLRHRILIECTNFKQGTQQSAGEEDVIVEWENLRAVERRKEDPC